MCFAESFLSPALVHSMPLPWPLVCGDTDQSPTRVGLSKSVSKVPVTFLTTTLIFFPFCPFFINLNTHNIVINTGSGKPKIPFCGRGYSLYLWSKRGQSDGLLWNYTIIRVAGSSRFRTRWVAGKTGSILYNMLLGQVDTDDISMNQSTKWKLIQVI